MVKVENLGVTIQKKEILHDISFEVGRGEIFGLTGDNGCGKTVLMKCISGLLPYSCGKIQVNGKYVGKDFDFPPDMGLMIETPQFLERLSGYKNLKLLSEYKHKIGKKEIMHCLEEVGLNPRLKIPVRKYSLGMRQRLGIAQAIMEEPELLILDEPFNSLDRQAVEWFRNWLIDYKKRGNVVILSSHNQEDIQLLCDQIGRMGEGNIIQVDRVN